MLPELGEITTPGPLPALTLIVTQSLISLSPRTHTHTHTLDCELYKGSTYLVFVSPEELDVWLSLCVFALNLTYSCPTKEGLCPGGGSGTGMTGLLL